MMSVYTYVLSSDVAYKEIENQGMNGGREAILWNLRNY